MHRIQRMHREKISKLPKMQTRLKMETMEKGKNAKSEKKE